MEIIFEKSELLRMLEKVHSLIPERSTMPVLSCVLIESKNKNVLIHATNLETSITTIGKGTIKEEGSIAISGKQFSKVVKELPDLPVHLIVRDAITTINCGKGRFKMPGTPVDEYPPKLTVGEGSSFAVTADTLTRLTSKTLFAVSKEIGSALSGGLLEIKKDGISLVATDGHKLALLNKKNSFPEIQADILVGERTWREASKLAGNCEIKFDENTIGFWTEDVVIVSKRMEGGFPDYKTVIPKDNDKVLIIKKREFIDALKRSAVFSEEITHLVRIKLKDNVAYIGSMSEAGEAREELVCEYDGKEMEIGYNATYLIDMLTRIETDEVKILLKDPLSAALITPKEQAEEEELTYLLMPIRLE